MNKLLEAKLVKIYPDLLQQYGDESSCMKWGFAHEDGWFDLVATLLAKLDIVRKAAGASIIIGEIKQKHGLLRVYCEVLWSDQSTVSLKDRAAWETIVGDIVARAEEQSLSIEEVVAILKP